MTLEGLGSMGRVYYTFERLLPHVCLCVFEVVAWPVKWLLNIPGFGEEIEAKRYF